MATKSEILRDMRAANDSKAAAQAIHAAIPQKHARARHYSDQLRAEGVNSFELCGQLLEHLEYLSRLTTCAFGAYDTAEKLAIDMGCSTPMLRRRIETLKKAGYIETALGIPRGRTGPTLHYRLTAKFKQFVTGLVSGIKRAARTVKTMVTKASKLALQRSSSKNPRPQQPFKSQATRYPVPAAHKPFQQEPRTKSAAEVGNSWISGIRALRAER